MKILQVLTSHDQLGNTGRKTGFWLEGAIFEKVANWQPLTITDGRLITGQNPASSTGTAQALMKFMAAEKAA